MDKIEFALEPALTVDEFVDVLRRSTLAERRPVDDVQTIGGMLANADIIVTARDAERLLVGVSRAITDFSYCTYLSDLAVDAAYQRRGIGKELIRLTHEAAGLDTTLILLAAPKAQGYYPHIGMTRHDSCWCTRRQGYSGRRAGRGERETASHLHAEKVHGRAGQILRARNGKPTPCHKETGLPFRARSRPYDARIALAATSWLAVSRSQRPARRPASCR